MRKFTSARDLNSEVNIVKSEEVLGKEKKEIGKVMHIIKNSFAFKLLKKHSVR